MALILGLLSLFSWVSLLYAKDEVVVFVVDPGWDCTESYVANVPLLHEYKIVKVMLNPRQPAMCNSDHAEIYQTIAYSSFTPNDALAAKEICPKLKSIGFPIAAVVPTFDPAVNLADLLAACVGANGNPSEGPLAKARWDKWQMSEAVRKAGIRSVREKLVTSWNEAKEYLESLDPPLSDAHPVIFKVLQGSSSQGVTKIFGFKQAKEVWNKEFGTMSYGSTVNSLLIQECFQQGEEYVIDSVSRDGVHKVVAVYHEDLRPGNGIFDLYYGFKVMDPEEEKTKVIMDYAGKVLTATGVRYGASDIEVFWIEEEGRPCVTDLNARWTALMWHDGLALTKALTGNDQITATFNAYLDGDAFSKMPPVPSLSQHGAIIFGNAPRDGILEGLPGLAVVKKLPSLFGTYKDPVVGAFVGKPIRMNTVGNPPITILLADKDQAVVEADYNRVIDLEVSGKFFDIKPSEIDFTYSYYDDNDKIMSRTKHTLLTAFRPGDGSQPGNRLPGITIAAVAMLAVAAVLTFARNSRRNVPDVTDYLIIE